MRLLYHVILLVLFCHQFSDAQESTAVKTVSPVGSKSDEELNQWRGSSLGIRLDFNGEFPEVVDVYDHVALSCPFKKGDQILKLEAIDFEEGSTADLTQLMANSAPGSELSAIVQRGSSEIRLNVATFRKELIDVQAIFRRLSKNKIILDHLKATERANWFDNFKKKMVSSVRSSQSPREASESMNRIIDEIGVSHTAIIPASVGLGFTVKRKAALGLILQRHRLNGHTGYFVIDIKPGSSAFESPIELGDEILSLNGIAIEDSARLRLSGHEDRYQLFSIAASFKEKLEIEYLEGPFDDSQLANITIKRDPGSVGALRASSKTISIDGKKIAYFRFWNLMHLGLNAEFSNRVRDEFSKCDSIVMDLRGRGGIVPAVLAIDRTVKNIKRPVVVIVDGLTRSAKEMLTYLLKKHEHVLVVGSNTSGAVTGATMAKLPSGNSLMFPVASADTLKQFVDGVILEGVGVAPDEEFQTYIPYAGGHDRLLNFALKRAANWSVPAEARTPLFELSR